MLSLDFPTSQPYPYSTSNACNASFLISSLGSFWNSIFTETGTLRGYTIGDTEELIQSFQTLTETVNSYSVSNCPVFHQEIWQPITLQRSLLDFSPFVFGDGSSVFGPQPASNPFYANQTFQFGRPKATTQNIYSYTPNFTIGNFSIILQF